MLEKRNYCNKVISQLHHKGHIVKQPKEILKVEQQFYKELYSKQRETPDREMEKYALQFIESNAIPKINEDMKVLCDSDISESEIFNSLKSFKNGKSPGTDGLVIEFYKFFWKVIKPYLMESYKHSLLKGELSVEQKRAIITLIPKKDKDRLFLKNWRPISLLNVDYKILTKTLANRLSKVLPHIINNDQTGYIKGRFIGCNIRIIEDILQFTDMNNLPGIILNIDFEKAFDSISWQFIEKSLETFNFGQVFISYVKTLYTNISATVINNGQISEWFTLYRGVRQGCPISPYLFILSVELLAICVRENKNIRGIRIKDTEVKITQLADDTTCFVSDVNSVSEILNLLHNFHKCAGLKVNVEKTKAIYIGSLKGKKDIYFNLDWSEKHIISLGVTISGNEQEHYDHNFKKKLLNLRNLLNSWKSRNLSLKGKVTVINTLALSSLLYLASVIHVPEKVIREVKELVTDFIWNGRKSKIAYNVLIQQIQEGGLKLIDFETKGSQSFLDKKIGR